MKSVAVCLLHSYANTDHEKKIGKLIAKKFGRGDLQVTKFEAETEINRSLITINPQQNLSLWQNGGYNIIPTIEEMVSTYALWT